MPNWEYTFYVSDIAEAGIRGIPAVENRWDENGYRTPKENASQRAAREKINIVNHFGQKGWELISITPITFIINNQEIGQTTEIMFTFKKPAE